MKNLLKKKKKNKSVKRKKGKHKNKGNNIEKIRYLEIKDENTNLYLNIHYQKLIMTTQYIIIVQIFIVLID